MRARAQRTLVVALVVGLGGVARADLDQAQTRSAEGVECFRRGEYAQAIAAFEASYALRPIAELLYDIAQAYRRLGDCKQALRHYQRYLAETVAGPLRDKAAARIAEMSPCPVTLPSEAPSPAASEAAPVPSAHVPAAALPSSAMSTAKTQPATPPLQLHSTGSRARRNIIAGLASAGAAVALGAVAVYFSVETAARSAEATRLIAAGGLWTPSAQAVDVAGYRDQLVSGLL
jgi:iron complex outermembrane receptor protein